MNTKLQSNQRLMKIRESGGSIIGVQDHETDFLPASLYPTAPIQDIAWNGRDSMPVEEQAQYCGLYGSDDAYEIAEEESSDRVIGSGLAPIEEGSFEK